MTAAGGRGVVVACDHSEDAQVAALFERLLADEGRIDILVNNAAAIHDELTEPGEFWEKPLKLSGLIDVGVRSGYVASWHAARAMAQSDHGLIASEASILEMPQFKVGGYIKGSRDREDVSYARPLSLEVPTNRW